MIKTLVKTLENLRTKEPVSHGPLHLFPLVGGSSTEGGLALLDEAFEEGTLRAEELDESGSVLELRVANEGSLPVLILEGDELIGAKQNRVVNSSVLVAADSELVLPVSCVERGRWSYLSRAFSSGDGSPHLSLRRLKSRTVHDSLRRGEGHESDQMAVWEEVARKTHVHNATSPTDALQDARASIAKDLATFRELADKIPEDTRGAVVALGGRPVFAEILPGPRSFAKASPKLLAGYAFEALENAEDGNVPDAPVVEGFLRSVSQTRAEEHPAIGLGQDVRFESEGLLGYALMLDEGVLHAAAFTD